MLRRSRPSEERRVFAIWGCSSLRLPSPELLSAEHLLTKAYSRWPARTCALYDLTIGIAEGRIEKRAVGLEIERIFKAQA